jgi:hypothetical protein
VPFFVVVAHVSEPIQLLVRLRTMRRCVVAIVMVGAAACTSSSTHHGSSHRPPSATRTAPPTDGTVAGKLLMVGGPSPGLHRRLAGRIVVHARTRSGPVVMTLVPGPGGSFRTELPTGRYVLIGRSPSLAGVECVSERSVVVEAANTVKVNVICPVP